jgi:hypothetical protein
VTDAKFIDMAWRIYATAESLRDFNADIVTQFRANGGRIVRGPLAGAPLLFLTVSGPALSRPGRRGAGIPGLRGAHDTVIPIFVLVRAD